MTQRDDDASSGQRPLRLRDEQPLRDLGRRVLLPQQVELADRTTRNAAKIPPCLSLDGSTAREKTKGPQNLDVLARAGAKRSDV